MSTTDSIDSVDALVGNVINSQKDLDLTESGSTQQDKLINSVNSDNTQSRLNSTIAGLNALELLHLRFGHMSETKIKLMLKNNVVTGIRYNYNDIKDLAMRTCWSCQLGRMRAFNKPHSVSDPHKYNVFEKVACDYEGPLIPSVYKNTGFYLFSDRRSGAVFPYPVHDKGEDLFSTILDKFIAQYVEINNFKINKMQYDYDSVLNGDKIQNQLLSYKIKSNVSASHVHVQNGQVERAIQTVMDKSRIMMAANNIEFKYWDYAVMCACYILNRSPNFNYNNITPYELINGHPPDVSNFVPF